MTMSSTTNVKSTFDQAQHIPPDAIFALTAQYLNDSHPQKVNLGQGTYRDADGKPWVLPSVNKARETLLTRGLNHEYLPIVGLSTLREAVAELVLGKALFKELHSKVGGPCGRYISLSPMHLAIPWLANWTVPNRLPPVRVSLELEHYTQLVCY